MQHELNDSVARLLARRYGADERLRALQAGAPSPSPVWSDLCALGVFGLGIDPDYEGFGGSAADLAGVFACFGASLLVAPWLQAVVAARAIGTGGTGVQKSEWLPAIGSGDAVFNLHLTGSDICAEPAGSGWRLRGRAAFVHGLTPAAAWLVGARAPDAGHSLFIVNPNAAGVRLETCRAVDGSLAADVSWDGTPAQRLGGTVSQDHAGLRETLLDTARAALCAESAGLLSAAFDATVAYLKTRQQFGTALSENQALRHRVAEMYVALEQVRSMAAHAMGSIDLDVPAQRAKAVAQAKLVAGRHGKWITQQAIQLHGGMGMTDECRVSHFYRRMLMIDSLFGGEQVQLDRLENLQG